MHEFYVFYREHRHSSIEVMRVRGKRTGMEKRIRDKGYRVILIIREWDIDKLRGLSVEEACSKYKIYDWMYMYLRDVAVERIFAPRYFEEEVPVLGAVAI